MIWFANFELIIYRCAKQKFYLFIENDSFFVVRNEMDPNGSGSETLVLTFAGMVIGHVYYFLEDVFPNQG